MIGFFFLILLIILPVIVLSIYSLAEKRLIEFTASAWGYTTFGFAIASLLGIIYVMAIQYLPNDSIMNLRPLLFIFPLVLGPMSLLAGIPAFLFALKPRVKRVGTLLLFSSLALFLAWLAISGFYLIGNYNSTLAYDMNGLDLQTWFKTILHPTNSYLKFNIDSLLDVVRFFAYWLVSVALAHFLLGIWLYTRRKHQEVGLDQSHHTT